MDRAVPEVPRTGFPQQLATRAAFLCAGLCLSAWAPLVPFAKIRLHLSDGQLGGLLMFLGTGSVIGMPLAGALAGRFGCRRLIGVTALVSGLLLPALATVSSAGGLAATLVIFGAAVGSLDVVMNIHAVIVERGSGRAMMSGFHGLYSVGSICGAGGVSLMIAGGVAPLTAALAISGVTLALTAATYKQLLSTGGQGGGAMFAVPHGRVLLLGFFCFVLFLAEGSVLDWSGVLLTTLRGTPAERAGFGYAAFAVAMTLCRLGGDSIVAALTPPRVVWIGALTAAAGFVLAAAVPSAVASIVGFALVGAGASNVVPIMFSAAGRQTIMPTNLAIAAVTTLGYAGILLGPAMIGGIASVGGLSVGLATVAVLLALVAILSPQARLGE